MHTGQPSTQTHPAYSLYGGDTPGPLVLCCEHASARVPAPLHSSRSDRSWLQTHWGFDIGARTVTRELVRQTGSVAVLSRFSRLVCDPNRPPDHPDFIRTQVEGTPLHFNRHLDAREIGRRIAQLYDPYHAAVDRVLTDRLAHDGDLILLSVHTFTPIWSHRLRTMDVGVIFAEHDAVAARFAALLRHQDFSVALNQPYSGREGLAYSAWRHGQQHGVVYLEVEVNQSLVCTPARARKVARRLAQALAGLATRAHHR